jgi:hypothetical protein
MKSKPTARKTAKKKRRGLSKREFDRVLDQLGNGGLAFLTRGRYC